MNHCILISEKEAVLRAPLPVRRESRLQLTEEDLRATDIFLVDAADPRYAWEICATIRQHPLPGVYLRPIILVNTDIHGTGRDLVALADHALDTADLTEATFQKVLDIAAPINRAVEALPDHASNTDPSLSFRIVRYLYSRDKTLKPRRDTQTIFGLHYPEVEIFLRHADESIFKILEFLEQQAIVRGSFFERVHFCPQCHSAYINFLEICPQCKSADIRTDDLIHHFKCAHVAPESAFREEGRSVCPKCREELRHIGVDFDKPSVVYRCNACQFTSQDAEVSTICFHCGAQQPPENLLRADIKEYRLTALGENAAVYGMENLFQRIVSQEIRLLPYATFKLMVEAEIQRIKRYGISTSTVALFRVDNLDRVYQEFGSRSAEIFGEMSAIMRSFLRPCDLIASLNDSTFLTLMPETPEDGARTALARLKEQFIALFETNLGQQAAITTLARVIDRRHTTEALLGEVTGNVDLA